MGLDDFRDRQLLNANHRIRELQGEKEQLARLAVCLANVIRNEADYRLIDGQVALPQVDVEAVPLLWTFSVGPVEGVDEEHPDAEPEPLVLMVVKERPGANGQVVMPSNRIVRP